MKRILLLVAALGLVGAALFGGYVWDAYWAHPNAQAKEQTLVIAEGSSAKQISRDLEKFGVIKSQWFFEYYISSHRVDRLLQPGTYTLKAGMNFRSIVSALTDAQSREISVTVPEGYSLRQIGELLEQKGLLTQDDWFAVVGDPGVDYVTNQRARRPRDFTSEFPFLLDQPDNLVSL